MRLFMNQTNYFRTSPVLDKDGEAVETATVTIELRDAVSGQLITGSNITLAHITGGRYGGVMPIVNVQENVEYDFIGIVTVATVVVWYIKTPIKAIIRGQT